ncbi:mitotic spindle checkpoint protein mad1 [Moniliophthora roreri]|nr:mitotic spindle checkpoint protein mad1 [Moniliophthora roreri]
MGPSIPSTTPSMPHCNIHLKTYVGIRRFTLDQFPEAGLVKVPSASLAFNIDRMRQQRAVGDVVAARKRLVATIREQ